MITTLNVAQQPKAKCWVYTGSRLGVAVLIILSAMNGFERELILVVPHAEIKAYQAGSEAVILRLDGQLDHSYALLPLAKAQELLELQPNQLSGIELAVKQPFEIRSMSFSELANYPQPLYMQTWIDKFGYMYNDIQLIRTVMYIAMVLVIGVACFNIISTLVMAVKDKQGDIAIQRTLGANNRFIQHIFLWYGLISGMKGAVWGILLGVVISLNLTSIIKSLENFFGVKLLSDGVYFIDFLPSEIHWLDIVWVLLSTIILSLFASLYPAIRASKLEPAKVLSGH